MIEQMNPKISVKNGNGELTVTYRTHEFTLYAVNVNGSVASKSHVEIGPLEDGFLVKIKGRRKHVRAEELPIYGKSQSLYWTRYSNSFTADRPGDRQFDPYESLALEISYGLRADIRLLHGIEDLLSQYGKPALKEGLVK